MPDDLKGKSLDRYIGKVDKKDIIRRYASSLRLLHSLEVDNDALVQDLDRRLSVAEYNLTNNLVDRSQLQPENLHLKPGELYQRLLKLKPVDFDNVFTHGDYCLDNIIFDSDKFSGFIDIGNGGIADRYQDIALAIRTIYDEFDGELVDLFCTEYGLREIDEDKVRFYVLLDEFF